MLLSTSADWYQSEALQIAGIAVRKYLDVKNSNFQAIFLPALNVIFLASTITINFHCTLCIFT